ncbi:MAG: WxcM-like domain-containing protein [Pedobacter sp.]|nr:MAG: WxcM-like domain-containing protein [Pedobacter sp.]
MSLPRIITFKKTGGNEIGYLVPTEEFKEVPFSIKRTFWTYQIPNGVTRGGHAHHLTQQVLICIHGLIQVETTEKNGDKEIFVLDSPHIGLYLPPASWHTMTYSNNAIQLVLASELYDEKDYIRNFSSFINPNE